MPGEFTPFLATIKSKLASGGGGGGTEVLARSHFAPMTTSGTPGGLSGTGSTGPDPKSVMALGTTPPHVHGELNVEIKRDGDRITKIQIQCGCGELIELDCEY